MDPQRFDDLTRKLGSTSRRRLIKGFAVTLMVGVACSIFTGVTVTRVMFDVWVRGLGRTAKLDMG